MMNTPEALSAKTGSPFLTTLPSLLKATVPESFALDILISLTLFVDIRQ